MNGCVSDFLEQVKEALAVSPYLSGSQIVTGFSSSMKDVPLRRSMIAVSIGSLELSDGAIGRYYGRGDDGAEIYGRKGIIGVKLDIAVPKLLGGEVCSELLNALASAVISSEFAGRVISLKAGEIQAQSDLGALMLPVTLTLEGILTQETSQDEGALFSSVIVTLK